MGQRMVLHCREAADFKLRSDAYYFARQHGAKACVILVSADRGFTTLLLYLRSLGCHTAVVGRYGLLTHRLRKELSWFSPVLTRGMVDASGGVVHPKTWIEYAREDLLHLSELHEVFGTYVNWWLWCKDRKAWTIDIHKPKVVEMHT
jgi:hypothetical protein